MPVAGGQQKNQLKVGECLALRRRRSLVFLGGAEMQKADAIRIMSGCAKDYDKYLNHRNLLFVFGAVDNVECFEAVFLPRTFMHLTGVEPVASRIHSSSDFYKRILRGKLSARDFNLAPNGTTEMKLQVLPRLMQIHKNAKMVSDYDGSKTRLFTEKLAGGTTACLGFARDGDLYYPNTALREDIRNLSLTRPSRVLMILRKTDKDVTYSDVCYIAKGVDVSSICWPDGVRNKIKLAQD